ncbi:hypothetical protein MRX96_006310 [Rhipicephalus microplus]
MHLGTSVSGKQKDKYQTMIKLHRIEKALRIHIEQSRANAVVQREFPVAVTSSAPTPECIAVRGVLLRRCPCGQVVDTNDASQLLDWEVRRDVSIQCGLQEMAPLPLPTEIFPSAATVESIRTGTSCSQAGSLPSEFESGMEHGTDSAVACKQMFHCNRCQYSTPKLHKLRRHLLSHSAEKPFQCECKVCSFGYNNKRYLKNHMRQHLES